VLTVGTYLGGSIALVRRVRPRYVLGGDPSDATSESDAAPTSETSRPPSTSLDPSASATLPASPRSLRRSSWVSSTHDALTARMAVPKRKCVNRVMMLHRAHVSVRMVLRGDESLQAGAVKPNMGTTDAARFRFRAWGAFDCSRVGLAGPHPAQRGVGRGALREAIVALGRFAAGSKGCARASSRPLSALSPRLPAGCRNRLYLRVVLGLVGGSVSVVRDDATSVVTQPTEVASSCVPARVGRELGARFQTYAFIEGLKARPKPAQGNALGSDAEHKSEP
jgi:hypothetical protein